MSDLGDGPTTPRRVLPSDDSIPGRPQASRHPGPEVDRTTPRTTSTVQVQGASARVAARTPDPKAGMGVYAVRSLVDDGVYIGAAADIGARWAQHHAALERACHPNDALQAAWLRLGAQAFELNVLEHVRSAEDLAQAAQRWIDRFNGDGIHRVYNAHSRAIRKQRTPLNLDQAAQRLHLSVRDLQRWVREGRVPCHYGPPRSPSGADAAQMGFDREELDEAIGRLRRPHRDRVTELVGTLRILRHRVGRWLHLDA
jgi:hypothetical protein